MKSKKQLEEEAQEVLEAIGDLIKQKASQRIDNENLTEFSNIVCSYENLYRTINEC
ncbi:hypothetical protein [Weizmannia acidilactici]|uniref:hypothetical protein n=1 Tax=Weizmannia acidilactici TaxID=2607726 RepID=UPI00127C61A7|nr:hypothetical protein [Weizmannia acidilactici]GER68628.1 hypothetical protein BpJC4_30990 [Weizmannia acidilactici]GER75148.1 hypothetical protein BpPP18_32150 [Weizmannia acidilactici]